MDVKTKIIILWTHLIAHWKNALQQHFRPINDISNGIDHHRANEQANYDQ